MSKRGGKKFQQNRNGCLPRNNGMLWQTNQLNQRIFSYYRNVITQMAMTRFRWVNLPSGCDERYLELQLLIEGVATIAFPATMKGEFRSLKAAMNGRMTMYGNPSSWVAIGDNGTRFKCNPYSGVLIYDNATRYPLMNGIELYANELTHIRITKRMNRLHQQIPFILKGPQEKKQEMLNLFKQISGGEPAVITTGGIDLIDVEAMQTGVQYIGEDLAQDESNVWNRIYNMLGISNTLFKAERQTDDEIHAQMSHTELVLLNSLKERRKAADALNDRFGAYLDGEIEVHVNEDWESDNFNLIHNIERLEGVEDDSGM